MCCRVQPVYNYFKQSSWCKVNQIIVLNSIIAFFPLRSSYLGNEMYLKLENIYFIDYKHSLNIMGRSERGGTESVKRKYKTFRPNKILINHPTLSLQDQIVPFTLHLMS